MTKAKKIITIFILVIFLFLLLLSYIPAKALGKVIIPKIGFVTAPVTEYTVGDRVKFNISAPNYGGRVEYRVILWEDSKKTAHDLWNSSNGYPNRYYTKWQPYGNNTFNLGWPVSEPGTYRITVYVKRLGIANNKAALKGMNCDSYKESVAFVVKPVTNTNGENNGTPQDNSGTSTGNQTGDNSGNTSGDGDSGTYIPGTGTNTETLAIEKAGVVLSNGTKISGTHTGENEYYVDLSSYAGNIGVKTSITVNKDCVLEIMGTKFTFKADTPRTFGPKDFGLEDNDPPGISLSNMRENYSNSLGYYTDSTSMTDESGNKLTLTLKIKVK